jgi:pimeloyl-ACP methyl ester carboxylesterase
MPGERIVHVNGVGLCAETFGDRDDPGIVLIHGAGSTMLSWDEKLCVRLAAGPRFVVRYDLRDSGRSATHEPGATPYTAHDLAADAVGLLDALGLERAHFVGMSLGAGIAQLLAIDHPDRVATVTLASATPGGPGHRQTDLPGMTHALRAFFADEPSEPDWGDRAAVVEYLVEAERPYAARFDEAAARQLAGRVFDRSPDLEAHLTDTSGFEMGDPWRHRLGAVAAPTLVIHGVEDPLFAYEHALALANEIPGAELLRLERVGHEYFPPASWDVVVPAILRHTSGR